MINIKKPSNFRDLGGLKTVDGRTVKEKRILRSGEPVGVPEETKELLVKEYHLKAIADFRTMEEVEKAPDDQIAGVSYHHIDILKDVGEEPPSLDGLTSAAAQNAVDEMMQLLYRKMLSDETIHRGYREFIQLLEDIDDGAVLFHCFAGKDRTGLGAVIILELLGVKRELIIADYLRTNELRAEENEMLLAAAGQGGTDGADLAAMKTALEVKQSYLEAAYDEAEKLYGSFDGYLREALKVTEATRQKLRDKYLV